ncbi:hypothetical protein VNI00_011983 [Paramarasmius palmivorus]|uniref:Uncharacterized protein n=1 Tax=Paramarasmius palmivorus TaxID=297713 RepID=A0AAW0C8Z9_9AGAR
MAPKGGHKTGPLRPHSRSSSATRITPNLQFTQKEQFAKHPQKKNGYDVHLRPAPTSRVSSKDQIAPLQKRHAPPAVVAKPKSKAAFTVAVSPGNDDGDDDEWVSSESGVTTPNPVDSDDSEGEMEATMATPVEERRIPIERAATAKTESELGVRQGGETPIARVNTMRPSHTGVAAPRDNDNPRGPVVASRAAPAPPVVLPSEPTKPKPKSKPEPQQPRVTDMAPAQLHSSSLDTRPPVPRPANTQKRQASTRPPSTYSTSSKVEHPPLRPHPLIRGQSFGQPVAPSRSTPLAPLTTTSDAASTKSSSPPHDSMLYTKASASPSTISVSPTSPYPHSATATSHPRRTSVSSVRSIATLPATTTARETTKSSRDRNRTLSTISQSSSSAALSSLAHLPAVTRPPSPQMIAFFPPVKPQSNPEAIHDLLPPPYLSNHLTVLAHRTPLRESYDRVMRARAGR